MWAWRWHRYQILLQSKLLVTALIMWVMRGQRQTALQWNVLGEDVGFLKTKKVIKNVFQEMVQLKHLFSEWVEGKQDIQDIHQSSDIMVVSRQFKARQLKNTCDSTIHHYIHQILMSTIQNATHLNTYLCWRRESPFRLRLPWQSPSHWA